MRLLKQYLLKQQLRCHTSDLLGVVACALDRRAVSAPTDLDALQHVIGIAVRIRPKIGSGRNMDYFHFASDLELLACHRCQFHHAPPFRGRYRNFVGIIVLIMRSYERDFI